METLNTITRVLIHIIPVGLVWWSDGMNLQQLACLGAVSDRTETLVHNERDVQFTLIL